MKITVWFFLVACLGFTQLSAETDTWYDRKDLVTTVRLEAGVALLDMRHLNDFLRNYRASSPLDIEPFSDSNFIFGVGLEASYKRLILGFNTYFTLTQVNEPGPFNLYQLKFFTYGGGIRTGWMLLPEKSFFNLIPAIEFGYSYINTTFPNPYIVEYEGASDPVMESYVINAGYYTANGTYFGTELTSRISFSQRFSLDFTARYRFVNYNQFHFESSKEVTYITGSSDRSNDQIVLSASLAFHFLQDDR
jgi:hypothetical protein